jgi:probable rRNA maturation factor
LRDGDRAPLIEIAVEAGDWPAPAELRRLVESAVTAAVAALSEQSARRDPSSAPPERTAALTASERRGASRSSGVESLRDREVSILFSDDAHVRTLNAAWRGMDRATNVLSFPQGSGPLLGDVILAFETVTHEAALAGKPLMEHMGHLIVHGFLHLLGYDHEQEAEAEEMEALERAALERMGFPDPYAAAWDE